MEDKESTHLKQVFSVNSDGKYLEIAMQLQFSQDGVHVQHQCLGTAVVSQVPGLGVLAEVGIQTRNGLVGTEKQKAVHTD